MVDFDPVLKRSSLVYDRENLIGVERMRGGVWPNDNPHYDHSPAQAEGEDATRYREYLKSLRGAAEGIPPRKVALNFAFPSKV